MAVGNAASVFFAGVIQHLQTGSVHFTEHIEFNAQRRRRPIAGYIPQLLSIFMLSGHHTSSVIIEHGFHRQETVRCTVPADNSLQLHSGFKQY